MPPDSRRWRHSYVSRNLPARISETPTFPNSPVSAVFHITDLWILIGLCIVSTIILPLFPGLGIIEF